MPTFIEYFVVGVVFAILMVIIGISMFKTGKDEGKAEAKAPQEHQPPTSQY